jgi:hypothetical protein
VTKTKKHKYKSKQPVIGTTPVSSKTPVYLGSPNLEDRHLAWRFSTADLDGDFACGAFDLGDFQDLWNRLRAFEGMNIAKLRDDGSFHDIPTIKLEKSAKERLQQIKLDDVDKLYSFHIKGACRLWCMKYENIFCVLWWDRHHGAYRVSKKHT